MNNKNYYFPELDSLRFFAFLVVLVHHSPFAKEIPGWSVIHNFGWVGVDIFLCLSAFLFARLLFAEHQERGDVNVWYFYLRRALRIWPLYFTFTGVMLVYFLVTSGRITEITSRLIGLFTFTDNLFSMVLGYNVALLYVAHLWTISYEEQVYLVIPWALKFFYRQKAPVNILILGGFAVAGMALRGFLIYKMVEHPAIWVFPLTHFEAVLGGLIIGLGIFDAVLRKIPALVQLIAGLVALYMVTLLPNVNQITWQLMLTYPLVGIGVSLILSAVMQGELGILSNIMKNAVLGYFGKISYGLYVYHILTLEIVQRVVLNFISPERVIAFPAAVLTGSLFLTIAVSAVSYQILEKPFQRLKSRFTFIQSRSI